MSTVWNVCDCGAIFDEDEFSCPGCRKERSFSRVSLTVENILDDPELKKQIRTKHHSPFFPSRG